MTGPAGRICAVLGSPVGHSLSPVLHRAAYRSLGLADWSYQAVECDQAGLAALIDSCGPQWAGLSLTMPLKQAVLPLLTDAEPLVATLGAANTLLFDGRRRTGCNTDVAGLVAALAGAGIRGKPAASGSGDSAEPGMTRPGGPMGPVLILGAGATACAALAALKGIGISTAAVAVRDLRRTDPLLATAARLGVQVSCLPAAEAELSGTGLLISTVPGGAADFLAPRLLAASHPPVTVFDVVYHPWPTRLASAAEQAGSVVIGGFELLLHQAARQLELMTGLAAPVAEMRAAGQAELGRRGVGEQAGPRS